MVSRMPSKSCRDSFADKVQLDGSQALPMVIERFLDDHDDALNARLDTSEALNGLVSAGARAAHARMRAYQKNGYFLQMATVRRRTAAEPTTAMESAFCVYALIVSAAVFVCLAAPL